MEPLRVVYYGGLDPSSGISEVAKKYALYFDEMYVVNSYKLLELYEKEYEYFEYYNILERCKTIMDDLREFSKTTGFKISFYDPIEKSNINLWKLITEVTERDLREEELKKEAVNLFGSGDVTTGMLTGINIALSKSIEMSCSPITNEIKLNNLTLKKMDIIIRKTKESFFKESLEKTIYRKFNPMNLYGFEIFNKLPLPLGDLSEKKIAELRQEKKFENFRESLAERACLCVEKAASLAELDKVIIPNEAEKLQNELRSYQKVFDDDIPKLRSDVKKNVIKDAFMGLLSASATGIPLGVLSFLGLTSIEYILGYIRPKKNLLQKYDPCCTFLFDLSGSVSLEQVKRQKRTRDLQLPKIRDINQKEKGQKKMHDEYGALASRAAIYFET